MRTTVFTGSLVALCAVLCASTPARADGTALPGVRPLGTGGAGRALATGDAGPMLNPSGMSLMRAYIIDGSYLFSSEPSSHAGHVSIVDSTSDFQLAGGLFYTYQAAWPETGLRNGNESGGLSLSFPIADTLFLGGTAKYVYQSTQTSDPALSKDTVKGFTFDAGLTLRPVPMLSIGVVGYNLRDLGTPWAPRAVGGGIALAVTQSFALVGDTVLQRVYGDPTRDRAYSFMGGGEIGLGKVALRAGGGHDGLTKHGYFTGGVSLVSDMGAIDLSLRQDVSGDQKSTFIGAGFRLFAPSN